MRELCDVKPSFVIDTSTPETLERDFYAWLKGDLCEVTETKICTSSKLSASFSRSTTALPPIEQISLGSSSSSATKCVSLAQTDDLLSNGASPAPSSSSSSGSPQSFHSEISHAHSHPHHHLPPPYPNIVYAVQHYHLHANININNSAAIINPLQVKPEPCLVHPSLMPPTPGPEQGVMPLMRSIKQEPMVTQEPEAMVEFKPPMMMPVQNYPSTSVIATAPPAPVGARTTTGHGRSSGTNQLGRTYSPGLPLSMADREQIVTLYQAGWKICDISKKLCVTHSCVSKILNRFRTTGSVRPKDAKEGRMESPLVAAIRDYRYRLGMTRQSQIREQLIADGVCRRENAPSRSSINHILRTKLDVKKRKK